MADCSRITFSADKGSSIVLTFKKNPPPKCKTTREKTLNDMTKLNILLSNQNTFRDKDAVLKDFLREMFDQEQDPIKCDQIIMAAGHYGYYQLAVEMQKDLNTMTGYRPIFIHSLTNLRGLFDLTEKEASHG